MQTISCSGYFTRPRYHWISGCAATRFGQKTDPCLCHELSPCRAACLQSFYWLSCLSHFFPANTSHALCTIRSKRIACHYFRCTLLSMHCQWDPVGSLSCCVNWLSFFIPACTLNKVTRFLPIRIYLLFTASYFSSSDFNRRHSVVKNLMISKSLMQ